EASAVPAVPNGLVIARHIEVLRKPISKPYERPDQPRSAAGGDGQCREVSRRLATAVAGALLAVALVTCGQSGTPAERALSSATDRLSKIRSGTLSMLLLASTDTAATGRGE